MEVKEIVSKLFDISLRIYEKYQSLKKLDYNESKDSIEYQTTISVLSGLLKEEQEIYATITDRELMQEILLHLSQKEKINSVIEDINILIANNMELIKRRIIINLLSKKQNIDKNTLIRMAHEVDKELKENNSSENNSYYSLINLLSLSEETKRDFIKGILLIISNDTELDKDTYINLLYNSAYLFPFCERELLKSNFEIANSIYFCKNIVADFHHINNETVANTNKLYGWDIIKYFKTRTINEYVKIIIRTALLFCSKEEIDSMKSDGDINYIIEESQNDITYVRSVRIGSDKFGK